MLSLCNEPNKWANRDIERQRMLKIICQTELLFVVNNQQHITQ
jgi:hypothetical protein